MRRHRPSRRALIGLLGALALVLPFAANAPASADTPAADTSPVDLSTKIDPAAAKAERKATVTSGSARFQVLTSGVIRLEYAPDGDFTDRPTFNVLHRNLKVPHFTTAQDDGWLVLRTSAMVLRYKTGSGPFGPTNTRLELLSEPAEGPATVTPTWTGECVFGQVCQSGAATLSGGASLGADHTGYDSLAGFVAGYTAKGAQATWQVLGSPAGPAHIAVRYANGQSAPRTLTLDVNGTATPLTLPATAGWDDWATVTAPVTLTAGTNTVAVTCGGDDTCDANVDDIAVTAPGTTAAPFLPTGPLGGYIRSYDSAHGSYTDPVTCADGQSQATCTAAIPKMAPGLLDTAGWYLLDDTRSDVWTADGWIEPRSDGDVQDGYLFGYGQDYTSALTDLAKLTGPAPMLPENVFGNWFSHYHGYSAKEYQDTILPAFQAAGTSLDALSVDTDWKSPTQWNGWEWNPSLFPDPKAFTAWAKAHHIDTTLNVHASVSTADPQYDRAQSLAGGTLKVSGTQATWDWSDRAHAQSYFALHQPLQDDGAGFTWLDWCCDGSEVSAPGVTPDAWINHLYAQQMANTGRRGFDLSRIGASYQRQQAGAYATGPWADHRSALAFTGDTWGTWNTLASQARLTQAEGSIGQGYVSNDTGSFLGAPGGGKSVPSDLYLRWLQLSTFQPIMRLHSNNSQDARVPWAYDPATRTTGERFLRLRERLVPYVYTLAHDHVSTGLPMARALYLDHPGEKEAYAHPGEYLFGSNMLVAPVTTPGQTAGTSVWFPPGRWIDWFTGATFTGPATRTVHTPVTRMPVFVKAGGIVPLQPATGSAATAGTAPLTFKVFAGADGRFSLYEDAGQGLGHQRGEYAQTPVRSTSAGRTSSSVVIGPVKGSYPGAPTERAYTVELVDVSAPHSVLVDGRKLPASAWSYDAAADTLRVPLTATPVDRSVTVTQIGGAPVTVPEPTTVDLSVGPGTAITPGEPTAVTATVKNVGPGAVTAANVTLTAPEGWTLTPTGGQPLGDLAVGQTATARWTVTATPADRTVSTATLEANLTYTDAATGSAEKVTTDLNRTVLSYGTRVGGLTDPAGDDNGPGGYLYPTDGAFNPGSLDLTDFAVYRDGDKVTLVSQVDAPINNPWGGNGMSTQRVNIYVHDAADPATTPTPLLPGTNMNAAGPWSRAIVADGRYPDSTYGAGIYDPDLHRIAPADLTVVPETRQIAVTLPAAAFGTMDLASATYQVSMFSDAEDGEGIGNVRPVYGLACWQGEHGCPSYVGRYRLGGGAGDLDTGAPSRDTDTSDPNAIDIISGPTPQSRALDWTAGSPVAVPYVPLAE